MSVFNGTWIGIHINKGISSPFEMMFSMQNSETGYILEPFGKFDDLKRKKRGFHRAIVHRIKFDQEKVTFGVRYLNRNICERSYEGVLRNGSMHGTWNESSSSGTWRAVPKEGSSECEQEALLLSCVLPEWLSEPNLARVVGSDSGPDLYGYPESLVSRFRKSVALPVLILYSGGSMDSQHYTDKIAAAIRSGVLDQSEREAALNAAGLAQFDLPMFYPWMIECGYTPLCLSYERTDVMPYGIRSLQIADDIWWDVLKFLTRGCVAVLVQGMEAFRSEAREIQYIGLRDKLRAKTLLVLDDEVVWLPTVLPDSTGGRSDECPTESWKWWEIEAALRWIRENEASHRLTETELSKFRLWSASMSG